MILYSTALLLGFMGSLHCLGMCGPIAMASVNRKSKFFIQGIFYNLGRITTYAILGIAFGLLGEGLWLMGLQQITSISIGILLLVSLLTGLKKLKPLINSFYKPVTNFVKSYFNKFIGKHSWDSRFILGLINGLLPCGLVYIAIAGAIATADFAQSALFMLIFGIGTWPMMWSIIFSKKMIIKLNGFRIKKLMPVFIFILSIVFVLRGLDLGIPYISPSMPFHQQAITTDCVP